MADQTAPVPTGPVAAPGPAPKVLPWLMAYTLGRLAIVAVLVAVLWFAGLQGIPGLLFGVLLAMPIAYFVLRPVRERLTAAIVARSDAKETLRARLQGAGPDDTAPDDTGGADAQRP
jgi:hypothetical protein